MTRRSAAAVFLLTLVTCGIYGLFWIVKTKDEMNRLGAEIPTAWLIIIPIANLYFMWKYCEGVDHVTEGRLSGAVAFIIIWIGGMAGLPILQWQFNQHSERLLPEARLV